MSDIYEDTIVEGVHENRRTILSRLGGEFRAYAASLASRRIPGVKYVTVPAYENCTIEKAS